MRARIAAGFCERISEWNGYGRAILQSSCGIDAMEGTVPDPSTTAGLMAQVRVGATFITPLPPRNRQAYDKVRHDRCKACIFLHERADRKRFRTSQLPRVGICDPDAYFLKKSDFVL